MRHGGTLVPTFDPEVVTHIVTDSSSNRLLEDLGLRRLSDIPERIPTVTWGWVDSGNKAKRIKRPQEEGEDGASRGDDECEYDMDNVWQFAAYRERIDAGTTPWGPYLHKQTASTRKHTLLPKQNAHPAQGRRAAGWGGADAPSAQQPPDPADGSWDDISSISCVTPAPLRAFPPSRRPCFCPCAAADRPRASLRDFTRDADKVRLHLPPPRAPAPARVPPPLAFQPHEGPPAPLPSPPSSPGAEPDPDPGLRPPPVPP